jgi:hypothetical protein
MIIFIISIMIVAAAELVNSGVCSGEHCGGAYFIGAFLNSLGVATVLCDTEFLW